MAQAQDAGMPDFSVKTNNIWYEPNLNDHFRDEDRQFFERYTGLSGKALEGHLNQTRDQAFEMGECPCVGMWDYLRDRWPQIIASNGLSYTDFTSGLASGARVLDVGCCFGQDLRRLADDSGASTEQWYATDLHSQLWDIGYDMFRDKDRFNATFIQNDLLGEDGALWQLDKKFDVILVSQVLHLFSWEQNISILQRLVRLANVGCRVVGFQTSSVSALEQKTQWGMMFFHNVDSWTKMWRDVGELTGTEWDVKAVQMPYQEFGATDGFMKLVGPHGRALMFVVTRNK